MKQIEGFWVPDYEEKIKALPYQRNKFLAAVEIISRERRGLAIDVGAHVGLWTVQMLEVFKQVIAFEPDPEKHECFMRNLSGEFMAASASRCFLLRIALGNVDRHVSLNQKTGTSLKTHVNLTTKGDVVMLRLDDLGIVGVDFLKVDCEGFDYFVMVGAEKTIRRDKPVIVTEQKPGAPSKRYGIDDQKAIMLLQSWGYTVHVEINGDFIMRPPQ